jgi:hypothetical protein
MCPKSLPYNVLWHMWLFGTGLALQGGTQTKSGCGFASLLRRLDRATNEACPQGPSPRPTIFNEGAMPPPIREAPRAPSASAAGPLFFAYRARSRTAPAVDRSSIRGLAPLAGRTGRSFPDHPDVVSGPFGRSGRNVALLRQGYESYKTCHSNGLCRWAVFGTDLALQGGTETNGLRARIPPEEVESARLTRLEAPRGRVRDRPSTRVPRPPPFGRPLGPRQLRLRGHSLLGSLHPLAHLW